MTSSDSLKETIRMIESLSAEEKQQLLNWIMEEKENQDLSKFSYLTSHTVLKKEWLNAEEDKAWENL